MFICVHLCSFFPPFNDIAKPLDFLVVTDTHRYTQMDDALAMHLCSMSVHLCSFFPPFDDIAKPLDFLVVEHRYTPIHTDG
ncbi:hypothetical protein [Fischerella thermalis]|uniref:hypothetical protein n=1 Tax=Fischerella thermalis TaxID=372787 RepID=UPI00307E41EE